MTATSRTTSPRSRAATRPTPAWRASLPVASGTAGLLSVGAVAARLAYPSFAGMLVLSISSASCAVIAGTVAIVHAMAARSPEIRRMTALCRLARQASSPAERLSAMAMLSITQTTAGTGSGNTAKLIHMVLQSPRAPATPAGSPQPTKTAPAAGTGSPGSPAARHRSPASANLPVQGGL